MEFFSSIRSRISRAYAALFAMTVIALSVFVPQTAHAGYASYSRPSMSYSRSYYSAPRVYVAPRPVVIVRPRPVVVVPMVRPYYRSPVVIAPVITPQTYVDPNGSAQLPVVASTGPSAAEVLLIIFLVIVVLGVLVGGFYGTCMVFDTGFDIFTDALIIDEIACGGEFL